MRKPAKKKAAKKKAAPKAKPWTAAQVSMLRKLYKSTLTTAQIAKRLKRTLSAVQAKARALGLKKKVVKKVTKKKVAKKKVAKKKATKRKVAKKRKR